MAIFGSLRTSKLEAGPGWRHELEAGGYGLIFNSCNFLGLFGIKT